MNDYGWDEFDESVLLSERYSWTDLETIVAKYCDATGDPRFIPISRMLDAYYQFALHPRSADYGALLQVVPAPDLSRTLVQRMRQAASTGRPDPSLWNDVSNAIVPVIRRYENDAMQLFLKDVVDPWGATQPQPEEQVHAPGDNNAPGTTVPFYDFAFPGDQLLGHEYDTVVRQGGAPAEAGWDPSADGSAVEAEAAAW